MRLAIPTFLRRGQAGFLKIRTGGSQPVTVATAQYVRLLLSGWAFLILLCPLRSLAENSPPSSPAAISSQKTLVGDFFTLGNKNYMEGKYDKALSNYLKAIALSKSEIDDLYYNVGCTYFQLKDYPLARYYFEKALKLDPKNEDLLYNIGKTKKMLAQGDDKGKDRFDIEKSRLGFWYAIFNLFTANQWFILGLIFIYIFFGSLIALRFLRPSTFKSIYSYFTVLFFSLLIFCAIGFSGNIVINKRVLMGIVLTPNAELRIGPSQRAQKVWSIDPGVKVKILESHRDFHKIRLMDNREGWVSQADIGLL